jgi:2-polyprenyl-6-methoxyphenol hydroxylase-like FAD-dependent oxidoreductase
VLIAGGGPAGLTLAISLGQLGVRCEVVDIRPAPARVPRAERCGSRAMEIFRRLGISGRLRAAGLPAEASLDVVICAGSLARPLDRHRYPTVAELLATTLEVNDGTRPLEPPLILSQYTLEPLLREEAEATPGVSVRFGAELIDFAVASGGVTAMLRTGSRLRTVRADYLVGCDGADSTVRQMLGIELNGETRQPVRQALIYCPDLYERLPGGPGGRAIQYHVIGQHPCTLSVQDDTQHVALHAPTAGPPMSALFEALAGAIVQPLSYKVLHEGEWPQQLLLASRYSGGAGRGRAGGGPGVWGARALLAGDAAHPASTTGGLGLSTAVADAADLAWKLAATLEGWAGPELLASYQAERRPVAAEAITASFALAVAEEPWSVDLPEVELGYRYTGSPVIAHPAAPPPAPFAPTTWPGARLPHIWLDDGSPLHDILGAGFTLLQIPDAATDRGATGFARELAAAFGRLAAPLDLLEVPSAAAQAVYAGHRLILVRPDLHVAWRSGDSRLDATALAALVTGHLSAPITGTLSALATGSSGKPGDVAGEHGVADERRRVDQRVRDDHRGCPSPAQEQGAEDYPHRRVAEEPAQPLVQVIRTAQRGADRDRQPRAHA